MRANVLPALTTALLALAACTDGGIDPRTNSGSHWLLACDSEADCADGLGCACGVCTAPCDAPGTPCTGETSDALCVLVESTPTGIACESVSVEAICLPECSADGDCPGAEGAQACEEGWCVPRAVAEPVDAGQDVALTDAGVLPIDADDRPDAGDDATDAAGDAPDPPDADARDAAGDTPIEADAIRLDVSDDSGSASRCTPDFYAREWSTFHGVSLVARGLPEGISGVDAFAVAPSDNDLEFVVRYRDDEACRDAGTPYATTQLSSVSYQPDGPSLSTSSRVTFPASNCDTLARVTGTAAIYFDPDGGPAQMLAVTDFVGVERALRRFDLTTTEPVDWQTEEAVSIDGDGTWLIGSYLGVAASGADGPDYALLAVRDGDRGAQIGAIQRGDGARAWTAETEALFPDADDVALGAGQAASAPSMALVDDCEVLIYTASRTADATPDGADITTHVRTRLRGEGWSAPARLELPATTATTPANLRVLQNVGGRLLIVESRADTNLFQTYQR